MKCLCTCFLLLISWFSFAQSETFTDSVRDGKLILNIRFRTEYVDFDSFEKDATAATFRTVLGYETASWRGLSFLAEFENVYAVDDDSYNSTTNGVFNRPVIPDPEDTELNRAQITYKPNAGHSLTLGRQRIILDDARFVGNVGWRQNEQTYDAVRYTRTRDGFSGDLIYIANVNRIFSEENPASSDFRMASYLGRLSYQVNESLNITGFGYFFEFENAEPLSHHVLGVRASGQYPAKADRAVTYTFSFANQQDFQNDILEMDSDYINASLGGKFGKWTVSGNYELLGSGEGNPSFFTPLATLHGFNGWADIFLGTPGAGLVDLNVKVGYKAGGINVLIKQHQFKPDDGSGTYGNETDAVVSGKFSKQLSWGVKAASYDSDDLGVDVLKAWAWIAYKY